MGEMKILKNFVDMQAIVVIFKHNALLIGIYRAAASFRVRLQYW